ncbi:expressed unknown protein [Seminavis robusta]|uniref:Uncharacterized protein n=1 Tax=Seminavis robusta TaxID=568900 RepID=A0A9N8DJ46_9STRA|nr:expressed unknown protein [Seminavis robusta]|eukprot:Sro156_g070750.1 n/a (414) ;mRNA; f:32424-33665
MTKQEVKALYTGNIVVALLKDVSTIASFSVAEKWNKQKTNCLEVAIQSVVQVNPILTSSMDTRKSDNGEEEIVAMFHTFHPKELLKIIPKPSKPNFKKPLKDLDKKELLAYLEGEIIPQFPSHVGQVTRHCGQEITDKSPVFEVHMMHLPENYACYSVSLSHCIGDGAIYYQVMEQLNSAMTSGTIETKINWDGYEKIKAPNVAPSLALPPLTMLGFMIGPRVFKKFGPKEAEPYTLLLSKKKIGQKKKELVDSTTKYLTSNDVVLSALCGAMLDNAAIQTQYVNLRGKLDELDPSDAGNYVLTSVLGAKDAASYPNAIRKVTASGQSNISPWKSFLPIARGNYVCNTNWAGLKSVLDGTVAHVPSNGFIRSRFAAGGSSYFTIIFEYDNEALGVATNCPIKEGGLLGSILWD